MIDERRYFRHKPVIAVIVGLLGTSQLSMVSVQSQSRPASDGITLAGRVVDAATRMPIPDARVTLSAIRRSDAGLSRLSAPRPQAREIVKCCGSVA
jgi:hypothetical protein